MTATFIILHPGIESSSKIRPRLAPRLKGLEGKRVALLDNGKVNAGAILAAVAVRLKELGAADARAWRKSLAAQPADHLFPEILDWKPDLVLNGVGD